MDIQMKQPPKNGNPLFPKEWVPQPFNILAVSRPTTTTRWLDSIYAKENYRRTAGA